MKVKVSGHQISKLQKQAEELTNEISNDKISVAEKERELKVLQDAIAALQKLGESK